VTHFLAMLLFSLLVSVGFAVLSQEHHTTEERAKYGVKVFAYFLGVGLLIAWLLYPFPL
jgi:hypothetical protein